MRPAPGPIPERLPDTAKVLGNIQYLLNLPRENLAGITLRSLIDTYGAGPVWLTGSTVWLPAVFDTVDENTDFDLVFGAPETANEFAFDVLQHLNRKRPGQYRFSRNRFGSARIELTKPASYHLQGHTSVQIMDIWALDGDESIAELLMSYPHDYQRASFYVSNTYDVTNLTRIVKLRQRPATPEPVQNMFRTLLPGRRAY